MKLGFEVKFLELDFLYLVVNFMEYFVWYSVFIIFLMVGFYFFVFFYLGLNFLERERLVLVGF